MAMGLKTSSCFDKVASILLPFSATMSPFWRHCRWCGRGFTNRFYPRGVSDAWVLAIIVCLRLSLSLSRARARVCVCVYFG